MATAHTRFHLTSFVPTVVALALGLPAQGQESTSQPPTVTVDQDGTVRIPNYALPLSVYMSEEAKKIYTDLRLHWPSGVKVSDDMAQTNKVVNSWLMPQLERARAVYAVTTEEQKIAGVRVDVVVPKEGVSALNKDRVVINLHGGGFFMGSGPLQVLESTPVAATARIKVISIDYRQSPQFKFPAASEDVAAVYRELLKQYKPQNIGFYGHSSGGTLAMMSVAWFLKEKLPLPGAIAICSAHGFANGGDSAYFASPLSPLFNSRSPAPPPSSSPTPMKSAYLAGANLNDPLVAPWDHADVLAKFPPMLIMTGTRDFLASYLILLC